MHLFSSCTGFVKLLRRLLCRYEDGFDLDKALGGALDAWKAMQDGDTAKEPAQKRWLWLVKEAFRQALTVRHCLLPPLDPLSLLSGSIRSM